MEVLKIDGTDDIAVLQCLNAADDTGEDLAGMECAGKVVPLDIFTVFRCDTAFLVVEPGDVAVLVGALSTTGGRRDSPCSPAWVCSGDLLGLRDFFSGGHSYPPSFLLRVFYLLTLRPIAASASLGLRGGRGEPSGFGPAVLWRRVSGNDALGCFR